MDGRPLSAVPLKKLRRCVYQHQAIARCIEDRHYPKCVHSSTRAMRREAGAIPDEDVRTVQQQGDCAERGVVEGTRATGHRWENWACCKYPGSTIPLQDCVEATGVADREGDCAPSCCIVRGGGQERTGARQRRIG